MDTVLKGSEVSMTSNNVLVGGSSTSLEYFMLQPFVPSKTSFLQQKSQDLSSLDRSRLMMLSGTATFHNLPE